LINVLRIAILLFGRRVRFAIIVLASQLLLVALAVVMLIQMLFIASNGLVRFVEDNDTILFIEILLTIIIASFGTTVFFIQLRRLGERRSLDYQRQQYHQQQREKD
jgi:hypothetical protein